MKILTFTTNQLILDLGITIITARISGVNNLEYHKDFEIYKQQELEKIKDYWNGYNYKEDQVLQGFRNLHTKVGRSNRDYVASPEVLVSRFVKTGYFPTINQLVDIYNLISLKTRLALGAHDVDFIDGNVTLKQTTGKELFIPLGKTEKVNIFPNEYGYIDESNEILCRLEVLQCNKTKVTNTTTDIFFIIQGNELTTKSYVENTAQELCELVTTFCGGSFLLLNHL